MPPQNTTQLVILSDSVNVSLSRTMISAAVECVRCLKIRQFLA